MRRTSDGGDAGSDAEPIRDSFAGFFGRQNGIDDLSGNGFDDLSGNGFWDTDARMTNRDLGLRAIEVEYAAPIRAERRCLRASGRLRC
jgi:hypothetical protein